MTIYFPNRALVESLLKIGIDEKNSWDLIGRRKMGCKNI